MSQQNVDTARKVLEAISRRDLEALLELMDPEIEWQSFFALGTEYHGHDGMRQYVLDLYEAFEGLAPTVDDMLDGGDVVVGVGRIHYRGRQSGVEADSEAGWMFKFRRGKVVRFRAFRQPEQKLESLGSGQ